MPKIKIGFNDHQSPIFYEEHIIGRNSNPTVYALDVARMLKVDVASIANLDNFIHTHEWKEVKDSGGYVICYFCGAEGERKNSGAIKRFGKWGDEKYFYCHDKRKKLPKLDVRKKANGVVIKKKLKRII
jgi:hypothetical protein